VLLIYNVIGQIDDVASGFFTSCKYQVRYRIVEFVIAVLYCRVNDEKQHINPDNSSPARTQKIILPKDACRLKPLN
jgi:hypothetical protein